jgi:hypothetical protein
MPAKSESQRRLLYARFGPKWVKAHGYDTKGRLPERAGRPSSLLDPVIKRKAAK